LRFLDREIDPGVAIVNRADPIRNGSDTVTRTVRVQFSDPRPWTLGNRTVHADGEQQRSQPTERLRNGPMENRTVGVTVRVDGSSETYTTDPIDPDTDGDGYWDGWIGVYNVSYDHDRGIDHAENVILYREHLSSNGISGSEIVQEQVGFHDIDRAPSPFGADIDGDGDAEHSNIHIGELQWNTDPTVSSGSERPDLEIPIEIDYHNRSEDPVRTAE